MARPHPPPPPPPMSPPPPSPPTKSPLNSTLDIDLDFIPFDLPSPSAEAGPSTAGPSTLPKLPAGLPSRPQTDIGYSSPAPRAGLSIESTKKKGKKRSIEEVDYGHLPSNPLSDGESDLELDYDGELDIDPHEEKLIRRLRATGIPWMSGFDWKNVKGPADMLNKEALAFWEYIRPTQIEHNIRGYVIDLISRAIKEHWSDAKIHVFGSYRTGLYLPYGDIDLVVESKRLTSLNPRKQIEQLASVFRHNEIAKDVQAIVGAKVPIVKFKTTAATGDFAVDVSIGQLNGVQSGRIIRTYFQHMPAMQPLIYLVKHFLWQRSLNEVFKGGLGSYSTILLVISFLQMHPKLRRNEIDPMQHLGELFIEFFELYGEKFNSERTAISLRNGGEYFDKFSRGWGPPPHRLNSREQREKFAIEDPQDQANDVSKGTYAIARLKGAFVGAMTRLNTRAGRFQEEHYHMSARLYWPNDPTVMDSQHPWLDESGEVRYERVSILNAILGLEKEIVLHRASIEQLYRSNHLQRLLGIAHDDRPSFFKELGEAAWVGNLMSSSKSSNKPSDILLGQSSKSRGGSGVRKVSAIMLEDDAEVQGRSKSGSRTADSEYFTESASEEGELRPRKTTNGTVRTRTTDKGKKLSSNTDSSRSNGKRRRTSGEEVFLPPSGSTDTGSSQSDDASEDEVSLSRYGIASRKRATKVIELSDTSDSSMEMDIDNGFSEEDEIIQPRDSASEKKDGRKPFIPSTAKATGSYSVEKSNGAGGDRPMKTMKILGLSSGSVGAGTPTPASKGSKKKVKGAERAAYWASKAGEASPAPVVGVSKKKGGVRNGGGDVGGGAEDFSHDADFIRL